MKRCKHLILVSFLTRTKLKRMPMTNIGGSMLKPMLVMGMKRMPMTNIGGSMLHALLLASLIVLAVTQQAVTQQAVTQQAGAPLPPVARKMAALAAASAMKPSRRRDTVATVELGDAGGFTILTKAGISTVPNTGDVAVSPIAATALTGFSLTADSSTIFSTSAQITSQAFAANYGTPYPLLMNSLFLTPCTPQLHCAS